MINSAAARKAAERSSTSARQQDVAEEGLRGCLRETDTNILRNENHRSVIAITARGRVSSRLSDMCSPVYGKDFHEKAV